MSECPVQGKMMCMYKSLVSGAEKLQDVLLLAVRAFWGWQFFVAGRGKFQNMENVVGYFDSLGIPMPELNAYMAAATECFGGLLLCFGLMSRLVSIPLAFTMIVAYATAHNEAVMLLFQDPTVFVKEEPFNYLLASLLVLCFGPGKISLDYLICKFKCKITKEILMNTKRLALSSIAVFIFIYLFEWYFHGTCLMGIYTETAQWWRPEETMIDFMHLFLIAQLSFSVLFCYIFAKGYEGRGIMEGVRFGIILGIFCFVPHYLIWYASAANSS